MIKILLTPSVLALLFLATNCMGPAPQKESSLKDNGKGYQEQPLHHASLFQIRQGVDHTLVTLKSTQDTSRDASRDAYHYWLASQKPKDLPVNCEFIKTPCRRAICLSSTQLAYVIELDASSQLVAINSSRFLFNKKIKERVASGAIQRIGKEGVFDCETIIKLNPDVIFVSPFKAGGYDVLKEMGIPLVPVAAYNEATPLGRAEWVKFIGAFMGKTEKADSAYYRIEARYDSLKHLAQRVKERPRVMSGKMKSGTWYGLSGRSYVAQFCRDAGARYILEDQGTGTHPMDFESMFLKGHDADFWRLVVNYKEAFSYDLLAQEDGRYADFNAFTNHKIFYCNMRNTPFYEETPVRPHVVLADYIKAFHPDLLPDYQPTYFKVLQ